MQVDVSMETRLSPEEISSRKVVVVTLIMCGGVQGSAGGNSDAFLGFLTFFHELLNQDRVGYYFGGKGALCQSLGHTRDYSCQILVTKKSCKFGDGGGRFRARHRVNSG